MGAGGGREGGGGAAGRGGDGALAEEFGKARRDLAHIQGRESGGRRAGVGEVGCYCA